MRTSAIFDANTFDVSKFITRVRTDKAEGASTGTVRTKGRGLFFKILCKSLLWKAPKLLNA